MNAVDAAELLSGFLTVATAYIIILHVRLYRAHRRFNSLANRLEEVFYGEAPRSGGEPETRT